MKIVEKRKIFFAISIVLILVGIISMAVQGLNLGLDFKGGTIMTVTIGEEYSPSDIEKIFIDNGIISPYIQTSEDNTAIIRYSVPEGKNSTTLRDTLYDALKEKYTKAGEASIESISATASKELVMSAFWTVLLAAACMLAYIWIRFELYSGIAAVIGIVHDLLIVLAVVSILQIQLNSTFIAAILTIFGYVINNTIIIFDRIRENNKQFSHDEYTRAHVVDISVQQSLTRTINTSVTTLLTISVLYVMGVTSIKEFTLPIIVGILSSMYSCIFINPSVWELLVTQKANRTKKVK